MQAQSFVKDKKQVHNKPLNLVSKWKIKVKIKGIENFTTPLFSNFGWEAYQLVIFLQK
jgi:hypothetical protein